MDVKVAIGGTFEELHAGHVKLIYEAFKIGDEVCIGLTSDMFALKTKKRKVLSYNERYANLKKLIEKSRWRIKYTIFKINDPYGPTIWDSELDCIIVSEETYARALEINSIRINRGLRPLNIIKVKLLTDEKGKKISSTLMWKRYGSIFTDKIKRNFS